MKKIVIGLSVCGLVALGFVQAAAPSVNPKTEQKKFRQYFKKRFPKLRQNDFGNGIYGVDKLRGKYWREAEDSFPAYLDAVELGKKLFNTPFKNGRRYANCFRNGGIGIKGYFPYFDSKSGKLISLEAAINQCRVRNGLKPLPYGKGKLAAIVAYMAYTSRGKKIKVRVSKDPRALALFERGRRHFYKKRGQLNFSCADCHVYNSGAYLRGNLLSPALGHVTHFPVWRKKWAYKAKNQANVTRGLGTLHRRFKGCNKQVRAKPHRLQSTEYLALEYFLSYMSAGLKLNGPALRP